MRLDDLALSRCVPREPRRELAVHHRSNAIHQDRRRTDKRGESKQGQRKQIKTLHHLVDGAVEALEFSVPADAPIIGIPLKDLKMKSGILLAGIVRANGQIVIPSGGDAIQPGDDVIVVTSGVHLQEIQDILK